MRKPLTRDQIRAHLNRLAIMRDVKVNKSTNHTMPQVLRKIIHCKKKCDDCNRQVTNREVVSHIVFYPRRHWLQQCGKCKMFLCRRTNKYNLNWQTAHSQTLVDIGHFRKSKPHSNQELSPDQQRNLQLYRNQLQSQRIKNRIKSEKEDK